MTDDFFFAEPQTPEQKLYDRYWQLMFTFNRNWDKDIDRAIASLHEARQIAEQLNDSQNMIEADHWLMQALIFKKRDYGQALPMAVKTAVEVRKPEYTGWRTQICVHQDLILSYIGTDPNGYDTLIEQALDYMDEQAGSQMQCRFCLRGARADYHLARFQLEQARKTCLHQLSMTEQPHYQAEAYCQLCEIAYLEKKWDEVLDYGLAAEKAGEKDQSPSEIIEGQAWQAVAIQQAGDSSKAAKLMRTAQLQASQFTAVLNPRFYNAQVAYYELTGEIEQAAAARLEQINGLAGKKGWHEESSARIDYCRLQARLNQLTDEEIKATEQIIKQLKDPAPLQQRLQGIVNTTHN